MITYGELQPLLDKYDGRAPRYTSYPPIPYWVDTDDAQVGGWLAEPRGGEDSLSLYTHIPFCTERCHYCGCFVVITPHTEPADTYLAAVHREMELVAARLPAGAKGRVRQYHLGGGTPNFISHDAMKALVDKAASLFDFEDGLEMSIEVDPRRLPVSEVKGLREIGFNRLSLGVQDFDPAVQQEVGRVEPYPHVAELVHEARAQGFLSVNFDLIYGLPRQTRDTFTRTVDKVLALAPDRLALYNFAYLPQAFPHQKRMDETTLPEREEKLAIFLSAREQLLAGGYLAIGMDHFARRDDELSRAWSEGTIRRNFMGYTTQAGVDMLAFGISGISEYNGRFWQNEKKLVRYERTVADGRLPVTRGLLLDPQDRMRKAIIGDLFCSGQVDLAKMQTLHAGAATDAFRSELAALGPYADDGLLIVEGERIRVSEMGQFFLRNIAMVFDTHLQGGKPGAVQFSRTL